MRRLVWLPGLLVLLAAATPPKVPSSLDHFRYRPETIRVGEVAHYVKSNLDGSKPARVSIFVASPEKLEVAKVEKDVNDAAWVRAHFDWKLFTADKLDAGVIRLDGSVEERATFDLDRGAGVVQATVNGKTGTAAWGQLPFHVYNFDFTSLNFAWRHLKNPKSPFAIGVIDPTFKKEGDVIFYRGAADVAYVGEESVHGKTLPQVPHRGPGDRRRGGLDLGGGGLEGRLAREDRDPVPGQPRLEELPARARGRRGHDAGRLEEVHRGLAGEGEREELARLARRAARNSFCRRTDSARIAANSGSFRIDSNSGSLSIASWHQIAVLDGLAQKA